MKKNVSRSRDVSISIVSTHALRPLDLWGGALKGGVSIRQTARRSYSFTPMVVYAISKA